MASIVGPTLVSRNNTISFSITDTLRNEAVDIGAIDCNYVIAIDGTIYQNQEASGSAKVVLVGGNDTFINEKQQREPRFYMTERQRQVLYSIMRSLANRTYTAQVSSDVPVLDQIAQATYKNYCG